MSKAVKLLRVSFLLFIMAIFSGTGCAPVKKNPYATKRKAQGSIVNASQLGRNKLYFSTSYQKKLTKSYKRK
jgi:hypothetical protein